MFIAIIGTRCSGKSSLEDYLVSVKGFISVHIGLGSPRNSIDQVSVYLETPFLTDSIHAR
jgi:dCMP deaminase